MKTLSKKYTATDFNSKGRASIQNDIVSEIVPISFVCGTVNCCISIDGDIYDARVTKGYFLSFVTVPKIRYIKEKQQMCLLK